MKKIITILIIMLILAPFVGVGSSLAYNNLSVELSDNYIGRSPQYKITFITPTSLKKGDNLKLTFDEQVYLRTEGIRIIEKITVNGKELLDNLRVSNDSVEIALPFDLNSGDTLQIIIAQGVVNNPSSPCYLRIILTLDGVDYNSNYYKITDVTTIKDLNLNVLDDSYKINFSVGYNGALEGYKATIVGTGSNANVAVTPKDYLFIRFSPLLSQSFSSFLSKYEITINGTQPPSNPVLTTLFDDTSNKQKTIQVIVPKNIYGDVEIVIKGFVQTISIPKTLSGDAYVEVWTSKETTPVKSNVISLLGNYVVETNYEIFPSEPDGENEFYITKPTVELSVDKGSSVEEVEIFTSIDGKDFQVYTGPIIFDDGIHTLRYYSAGYSGKKFLKEDIKEFVIKVDTTSPVINIISPLVMDNRIYTLKLDVSDDNIEEISVKLGSITFYPYKSNIEIPTILFGKETTVEIRAVDFAGHVSEYNNVIKLN